MMRTREEILKLAVMDPELTELVKGMPKPSTSNELPKISDMREYINEHFKANVDALGSLPKGIIASERTMPARDSFNLRLLIFEAVQKPKSESSLIILLHGGGGCNGTPEMETENCRLLTQAFGAVVISAQYRLAPEYPFPCGTLDAFDVLKWAGANAESLGATPAAGFIIGGTSAGARIAAVLSLLARDEKLSPPLTGQYLCVGAYTGFQKKPEKYKHLLLSNEQNANALLLNKTVREIFMKAYKPDDDSPLHVSLPHPNGHEALPPTYFQACGMDLSRDDSLVYEMVLREEAGVKTRIDVYPGLPHCFWDFFRTLNATKRKNADTVKGVGWLLGKEPEKLVDG